MNEHMDDQGRCYCGSLECLGNVRAMLSEAQVKLFEARAGAEILQRELDAANNLAADNRAQLDSSLLRERDYWNEAAKLRASIETVEAVWREQVQGYMGDWAEDSLLNTLAAEFDFEATEEVNVVITIEVSATITKPIGADVHYHDFDIDSLEISANESGWEMDLGDPEITDVN